MPTELAFEELQQTTEYQLLAPRWKAFVAAVLKTGDATKAASAVYPKHKNPAVCGANLMGRQPIIRCLDKFFGNDPSARLLEDLHAAIRSVLRRSKDVTPKEARVELNLAISFYEAKSGKQFEPVDLVTEPTEEQKS